jgi:chromosome segregation ATPase
MARKILSLTLIVLSAIFLLLSVAGIVAAWVYNEPLTQAVTSQLREIDNELSQAEVTLESTQTELERALRIVDSAEQALEKLAQQSTNAESLFENIQDTLDGRLIPELKTTRERLNAARLSLEDLQSTLNGISSLIPGLDLGAPGNILTGLIASTKSLDLEIANVEAVAQQASTFVSDTSYLLGGDLTETRNSLENFRAAAAEYQQKVTGWRAQVADLIEAFPIWIDRASISLTVFLLWFGLSQFGLLLHGLSIRRGDDPLGVLRRQNPMGDDQVP